MAEGLVLNDLFCRHAPSMRLAALWLVHNHADAEDVVQETFLAALRDWKSFRGECSPKTWLYRILTRKAARSWRRSCRQRLYRPVDPGTLAGRGQTSVVESNLDVALLLSAMPGDHRQVLVLRELQGFSCDEIARQLAIPRGTVESRLARAREKFRRELHARSRR